MVHPWSFFFVSKSNQADTKCQLHLAAHNLNIDNNEKTDQNTLQCSHPLLAEALAKHDSGTLAQNV